MVRQANKKKIIVRSGAVRPGRVKKTARKVKQEVGILGKALRSLGGFAGGAAGGFLGQPDLGRSLGTNLGASLSRWLGAGDYSVSSNTLAKASAIESIPMMHRNSQSVIVRHREFLGDISGSIAYTVQRTMSINPGLEGSFPWLSTIAQNFQEYTIRGMVYHYVPTAGDAVSSTNNALGSVVMSTNYRATATAPGSKMEQLNEYYSNDARPSEAFCHPIECDPRENPYNVQYVRAVAVPSTEDPKTYDLGTFYLSTSGMQADGIVVGELWCTYEVELRKPIAVGLTGFMLPTFLNGHSSADSSGTNLAAAFSSGPYTSTLLPVWSGTATSITATLPAGTTGTFLIALAGRSNVANATTWTAPTVTNAVLAHPTFADLRNSDSSTSGTCFYVLNAFTVTNPFSPTTVTIAQTSWTNVITTRVIITQIAP